MATLDDLRDQLKTEMDAFRVLSADLSRNMRTWLTHQGRADAAWHETATAVALCGTDTAPGAAAISRTVNVVDEWEREGAAADQQRHVAAATFRAYYEQRVKAMDALDRFLNRYHYESVGDGLITELEDGAAASILRLLNDRAEL